MALYGLVVFLSLVGLMAALLYYLVHYSLPPKLRHRGYDADVAPASPWARPRRPAREKSPDLIGARHRVEKKIMLNVYTVTWNMSDTLPDFAMLEQLLHPNLSETNEKYDVIAVGVQECNYKPRVGFTDCEADWFEALVQAAGPQFKILERRSIRDSIRLVIFIRNEWAGHVRDVKSSTYSTTLPMFYRKGGVGISFTFQSTTFCFVNVHLAAHQESVRSRNVEAAKILKELRLGNPNYDCGNQFHHCFFFGDLNYRIDCPWHDCVAFMQRKEFIYLNRYDQLQREQKKEAVLYGFKEPNITFFPTFKLVRGRRDQYDDKRTPSWCDRILYCSLPEYEQNVIVKKYTSMDKFLTSDHVPVSGVFTVGIWQVDQMVQVFPLHQYEFRLTDVELLLNGLSIDDSPVEPVSPRLICSGVILEKEPIKSSIQLAGAGTNLHFHWPAMPPFKTKTGPKYGYVQFHHLFLAIYNFKTEQREELYAQAAISLKPFVDTTAKFEAPLLLGGVNRGTIKASLQLV